MQKMLNLPQTEDDWEPVYLVVVVVEPVEALTCECEWAGLRVVAPVEPLEEDEAVEEECAYLRRILV